MPPRRGLADNRPGELRRNGGSAARMHGNTSPGCRNFDRIRPAVDRILQNIGGFAGALTASNRPGQPRSINGTLRIPSSRFDAALAEPASSVASLRSRRTPATATLLIWMPGCPTHVSSKRLTEVPGAARARRERRPRGRTGDCARPWRNRADGSGAQAARSPNRTRTLTLEIVEERVAAVNLGPVPIATRAPPCHRGWDCISRDEHARRHLVDSAPTGAAVVGRPGAARGGCYGGGPPETK